MCWRKNKNKELIRKVQLDEYVKTIIVDIFRGVKGAQEEINHKVIIQQDSRSNASVMFDLVVVAETTTKVSGGLAVKVLNFGGGYKHKSSEVNRIKFSVNVDSRTIEEMNKEREAYKNRGKG